jgi:hypothetical protein
MPAASRTLSAALISVEKPMQSGDFIALDALADRGPREGYAVRPILLRVLTDLYVYRLNHTAAEERQYSELALRLLEVVDVPTRVAVARRLARHLSPPLRVLQWLARDSTEVASEVSSHPLLRHATLAEAPTPTASAPECEQAVDKPSRAIDFATAAELNELFFAASAEERGLILRNLHVVAPIAPEDVRVAREPSVGHRLEAAALSRNRRVFVQQLAHALHIGREQASRIAADNLGEPVVIAAKALFMPRDVLCRVLMFVNPAVGHSVERVHALAALFNEMDVAAAADMVAIWQALQQSRLQHAKHQPLVADDALACPGRRGSETRYPRSKGYRIWERLPYTSR